MNDINIEKGTISFDGAWMTVEDLISRINDKITKRDFKVAALAAALEKLHDTLEKTIVLQAKLVLSNEDYSRFKEAAADNIPDAVTKSIKAFISGRTQAPGVLPPVSIEAKPKGAKSGLPVCKKCGKPLKISSERRPIEIECHFCGTSTLFEN